MKKIEAIQYIKNVGKFSDSQTSGCQFNDNTIIYGRNTLGKSTITSIFRSLQTGNKRLVEGRKTFGSTNNPAIQIRFSDGITREILDFESNKWSDGKNEILIFDTQFISDNVFQGEKITFENQKSLNQIIIGDKGIKLNTEIQKLQNELNELTENKRKLTSDFNKLLPSSDFGNISIEKFCALPEMTDLDDALKAKKDELERGKNKETILKSLNFTLSQFSILTEINYDQILNKVIEFNPSEIESHIHMHWKNPNSSKDFLKQGLELTKDNKDSCVFCGQTLGEEEINLLSIYEQFFKGEYQDLQSKVSDVKRIMESINLEAIFTKLKLEIEKFSLEADLDFKLIESLIIIYGQLFDEVNAKLNNIYYSSKTLFNKNFVEPLSKIANEIWRIIEKYFPKDVEEKSLTTIFSEIKELELNKKRLHETFVTVCTEFSFITEDFNKKREIREAKRKELDEYSLEIFGKHKSSINVYLRRMGANFVVDDLQPIKKLKGTDERLFSIKFYQNHTVSLDSEVEEIPNFKNSLSESDKRVLAFAFFLSLLSHDNDLDKKILVFDDPFSSFDEERKRDTIQLLADIKYVDDSSVKVPLQKIILTHEKTFYREIYLKSFTQPQTLKIEFDKITNGIETSTIKYCDIEKEFPDDYIIAKIKRLKDIYSNRQFSEKYDGDCRIILENIFKRKYYFLLEDDIKKRKSVRTFAITLQAKYSSADHNKLIRLCDDLNIELHDNHSSSSIGDHASVLRDFFECIEII